MAEIDRFLKGIETIGITGHIKPDGDCIGSCLGLYNYVMANFGDIKVDVYLDAIPDYFNFIKSTDKIIFDTDSDCEYDLFISVDASDTLRLGSHIKYFNSAKRTLCIDHHVSNVGFADDNIIMPDVSSTCEVIYGLLNESKINLNTAEALYTGIIHDTGVFRYSSTTEQTMQIAGKLIGKGIDFSRIIMDTYFTKTFAENQILGKALLNSKLVLDGKCVVSVVTSQDMEECGVDSTKIDGIIEQLRVTKDTECAVLLYQTGDAEYKASMRSIEVVDVSKIAVHFGGGGHIHAAGCTMKGSKEDALQNILAAIQKQLLGDCETL